MASSRKRALAVVFDSNFLMAAARLHFDLFDAVEEALDSPFDAQILVANVEELTVLAQHSPSNARKQARVALKLAGFCKVVGTLSEHVSPDDALIQYASSSHDIIVATNDAALRARLREVGRPVLHLRRSGALDLIGFSG